MKNKLMRIVFIGTVKFGESMLKQLIFYKANVVGVLTKEKSDFNADFSDLSDLCSHKGIPCRYVTDINSQDNIEWIRKLSPDIIFCFGFSQILKKEIIYSAPMGIVGFHPAILPQNRGRHPIVWALALGLERTASTFFFIDDSIDGGDLLSQEYVDITYEDNAKSLYNKITNTALTQMGDFLPKLQNKTYCRISQDNTKANFWRKRREEDGKIDFRMTSRGVYNLVRALTKPYIGAHIFYNDVNIKIWEAKEVELTQDNIESGKVLDITDNKILVKCYNNAVILTKHEFNEFPKIGEYLL
ncbi:MAG: formyltransferase family protein [Candidatus Omnitrophota bacterium]